MVPLPYRVNWEEDIKYDVEGNLRRVPAPACGIDHPRRNRASSGSYGLMVKRETRFERRYRETLTVVLSNYG
jgi:hypothetical protein